jgi:hypothetical protein
MTSLILLFQADSDVQSAFNRYEEIQPGLGEVFLRQLDLAFGILKRNPELGRVYGGKYRRLLIHGFPYGVFYQHLIDSLRSTARHDYERANFKNERCESLSSLYREGGKEGA